MMIEYLRQYSKAIVGLLAPVLVMLGSRAGLGLSDEQAITLATLITGFLVYLVPNKTKMDPEVVRQTYEIVQAQLKQAEAEAGRTREL